MSWFGRKKRKDTPDAEETTSASCERRDENENARPAEEVSRTLDVPEGDILEQTQARVSEVPVNTGEFRATSTFEKHADDYSPQLDVDAAELRGGLSPVFVTEATREERVQEALERWRLSLGDLTAQYDFLLDMRSGPSLDLTHSHPQGLAHLFAARGATRLSSLVREEESLHIAREKARILREIAVTNAEDRGLTTCHLGIGEATWIDLAGREIHAPLLLRPINLHVRGSAREDVDLDLDAAVELNPKVLRALREEGVLIDARALLELTDSHHGFDPQPVLDAFRSLGEPLPGFRVTHGLVVGNVVDASGPMLEDFNAPAASLAKNPLIGALAGDAEATAELAPKTDSEAVTEIEAVASVDPDAHAIAAALTDQPAIAVHGAPGSSTSDVVVSLVTEQLAAGKRVLLVSQRSSRLAELAKGISSAGLDDLLLSLRPDPHLQREASKSLVLSLAKASSFAAPVNLAEPEGLVEARNILTGHGEAMHRIQQPWGVSAHEAINALADLSRKRPAPSTGVRLTSQVAERVLKDRERYRGMFERARQSGALGMKPGDSPWFGASITSETQAKRALELVQELDEAMLEAIARIAAEYAETCNVKAATTFAELRHVVRVLESMRLLFLQVKPETFGQDISSIVGALSDKQYRAEHKLAASFSERRRWKKLAKDLLQPSEDTDRARELFVKAQEVHAQWAKIAADPSQKPVVPSSLSQAAALVGSTQKNLDELSVLLAGTPEGTDFENAELAALHARMRDLSEGKEILEVLPARTSITRELVFEGFGALVEDLRERSVEGELVLDELELSWWVSVLEFIARAEPTLAQYDGTKLSQVAERYRRLDEEYMHAGRYRVRQTADDLLVATMKRFPDTSRSAIMELNGGGTMSVRDTAAKYQDIVFRARPLWLASPYMVPQMIPAGEHFDLVVIADAARLPTAAAIPALARARHAVVIGDPFEYAEETPTSAGARTFLLDDVSAVAPVVRILHDTHAATGGVRRFVSERATRNNPEWASVQAPPSPQQIDDDAFVYVPDGRGAVVHGAEFVESTKAELRRVTDLVIYHARHTPERSLAVVTLTASHAKAVLDHVMFNVRALPDLKEFFTVDGDDYFTVQAISEAGTLLRDDVIVSLGFGLTPHDRLLHRFGPLSSPGGRKALVSLLTRARYRTSIVSAVRSADIEPARIRSEGAADLRDFLEFVESGFDPAVIERFAHEYAQEQAREQARKDDNLADAADREENSDSQVASASEISAETEPAAGSTENGEQVAGAPAELGADANKDASAPGEHGDGVKDTPEPVHEEEVETHDSSKALVADLADRLSRMDYLVSLDYGLSAHKVELAIAHPDDPEHFLVAVATDGPRYRETPDQRERDRLGAERLERAGWTVERVWSWALFIDPEGEAERVRKTVERAHQQYLEQLDEKLGRGSSRHRLPKPKIPAGHPLSFYGPEEFDAVVAYICSDGKARLAEQLAAEVREFLAFEQRSVLLDVSVSSAIRRYQDAQAQEHQQ